MDHSSVADKTVADGTYTIHIDGKEGTPTEGQSYTVAITIRQGKPVSATLNGQAVSLVDGHVVLTNLLPGTYEVTEDLDSKTVLSAINSTDPEAIVHLDERKLEIEVSGRSTEVQLVTFTNNYADDSEMDIAHISVRKTFVGLTAAQIPQNFKINVRVTAMIDGVQKVFNYVLTHTSDSAQGIVWNQSEDKDGNIVWDWKIAIRGLNPDGVVKIEEVGYQKPGYEVTPSATPDDGSGTSYEGTVIAGTTVESVVPTVITEQSRLRYPLSDLGDQATIFIARIVPSQTSLVVSKNKLNMSERAALEEMLRHMPNAQDWYNGTTPMYYSFEEAVNNQIVVRNQSTVTYNPLANEIVFSKKAQWNMVGTALMTYKPGRPADFNFRNEYVEKGTGIDVVKVDKDKRTTKLPGAEFTITKVDEATTPAHIIYKKKAGTDEPEYQKVSAPTDADGKTSFSNLLGGYYEIKETKLPDGYILTEGTTFYIKIADGVAQYLVIDADPDKAITDWATASSTEATAIVQVDSVGTADDPATPQDETVNTVVSVGNTPGTALPKTGGPGTSLFYLLGIMLTVFAGAALVRKKMQA